MESRSAAAFLDEGHEKKSQVRRSILALRSRLRDRGPQSGARGVMVILEWRQLYISGKIESSPGKRSVTTQSRLVPPPGSVVRLRVAGSMGIAAQTDVWTVVGVEEVHGLPLDRVLHLERAPALVSPVSDFD